MFTYDETTHNKCAASDRSLNGGPALYIIVSVIRSIVSADLLL
jgi:hypothetical protein